MLYGIFADLSYSHESKRRNTQRLNLSPLLDRCVNYCGELNLIATGSWDKSVRLWDTRANACTGTFAQPDRVRRLSFFLIFLAPWIRIRILVRNIGRSSYWELRIENKFDQSTRERVTDVCVVTSGTCLFTAITVLACTQLKVCLCVL